MSAFTELGAAREELRELRAELATLKEDCHRFEQAADTNERLWMLAQQRACIDESQLAAVKAQCLETRHEAEKYTSVKYREAVRAMGFNAIDELLHAPEHLLTAPSPGAGEKRVSIAKCDDCGATTYMAPHNPGCAWVASQEDTLKSRLDTQ